MFKLRRNTRQLEASQALANQTSVMAVACAVAAVSTQITHQVVQLVVASFTAAADPHIQQQKH